MTAADVLTGAARWHVERADCLDFLRSLPCSSIDMVFGSPYYSGLGGRYPGCANLKGEQWAEWMVAVTKECLRVCGGFIGFVVDAPVHGNAWDVAVVTYQYLLMAREKIPCTRPGIMRRWGVPGEKKAWRSGYEPIVCPHRPGQYPYAEPTACGNPPRFRPGGAFSNRKKDGSRTRGKSYKPPKVANPGNVRNTRYTAQDLAAILATHGSFTAQEVDLILEAAGLSRSDVRDVNVGGGRMGDGAAHSSAAPFSEDVAYDHVVCWSPPGGVVLDVFCGSGTTGAVALANGRRFLGCDTDGDVLEVARARLSRAELASEPTGSTDG